MALVHETDIVYIAEGASYDKQASNWFYKKLLMLSDTIFNELMFVNHQNQLWK